jgi:hypothetical protein
MVVGVVILRVGVGFPNPVYTRVGRPNPYRF